MEFAVAFPRSGSSPTVSRSNQNLEVFIFVDLGVPNSSQSIQFGFIDWVDNVNWWPPQRDSVADVSSVSPSLVSHRRRANAKLSCNTPTDAAPQRKEGNKRKVNGWRKKKRTDFPFNFFHRHLWRKKGPLWARVQFQDKINSKIKSGNFSFY